MATPQPQQVPVDPKSPIPIASGTHPPAPPGMVAVPAAALSGRQQHAAQLAGSNIGVTSGLIAGGGADIVTGAIAGSLIGQEIGRYQRAAAMSDPNAPMVFVDENSRAGRRAIRRQKRRQRRQGTGNDGASPAADKKKSTGWLKGLFGSARKDSSSSDSEDDGGKTGKKTSK